MPRRKKFELYKKVHVRRAVTSKASKFIKYYYNLLKKSRMGLTQKQLSALRRGNKVVQAQDLSAVLPLGTILLHYFPKRDSYCGALDSPTKFGASNHASMITEAGDATESPQITHAVLDGVVTDPITRLYFENQYAVAFRIVDKYDPGGTQGRLAVQQMDEFKELDYDAKTAFGSDIISKVAVKSIGDTIGIDLTWISNVSTQFGPKALQRRRQLWDQLQDLRSGKCRPRDYHEIDWAPDPTPTNDPPDVDLMEPPDVGLMEPPDVGLMEPPDSGLMEPPDSGRRQPANQTRRSFKPISKLALLKQIQGANQPRFFCSELVILCYQLVMHTHDARFIQLDPHKATPAGLEKYLLRNRYWEPVALIEP